LDDAKHAEQLSEVQCEASKNTIVASMLHQTTEGTKSSYEEQVDSLDRLLKATEEDNEGEFRRKEEEINLLQQRLRKLGTDMRQEDTQVAEVTKQIKGQVELLERELQTWKDSVSEAERQLADIDQRGLVGSPSGGNIRRSRRDGAHSEEVSRLESVIKTEKDTQRIVCEELRDSIERARKRSQNLLNTHQKDSDELTAQISKKMSGRFYQNELRWKMDVLVNKIKELDNNIREAVKSQNCRKSPQRESGWQGRGLRKRVRFADQDSSASFYHEARREFLHLLESQNKTMQDRIGRMDRELKEIERELGFKSIANTTKAFQKCRAELQRQHADLFKDLLRLRTRHSALKDSLKARNTGSHSSEAFKKRSNSARKHTSRKNPMKNKGKANDRSHSWIFWP
jgi:hypothetical protein